MNQPISINGRWDLFYSNYSKFYDRFSHYEDSNDQIQEFIKRKVDIKDKVILDLGAGTGRYAVPFSFSAEKVYALEPSAAMRGILRQKIKENNIKNFYLIAKQAQDFKLPDNSIDVIFSSWVLSGIYNWHLDALHDELKRRKKEITTIIAKLERISKNGGSIIVVETAPGQYGGELQPIIIGSKKDASGNFTGWLADEFDFRIFKKNTVFNFQSVHEAAEIFGFVYGNKIREYIIRKELRSIKMGVCIMIKEIKK